MMARNGSGSSGSGSGTDGGALPLPPLPRWGASSSLTSSDGLPAAAAPAPPAAAAPAAAAAGGGGGGTGQSGGNSKRVRARAILQRLEAEALARSLELARLQEENGRLVVEHTLLATAADSLDALRSQLAGPAGPTLNGDGGSGGGDGGGSDSPVADHGGGGGGGAGAAAFPALASEAERSLLRQLSDVSSRIRGGGGGGGGGSAADSLASVSDSLSDVWAAAAGLSSQPSPLSRCAAPGGGGGSGGGEGSGGDEGDEPATVAPPDTPLALLASTLLLPPFPGAAALTLRELCEDYAATVRELALQLALHDAHSSRTPAPPGNADGDGDGGGGPLAVIRHVCERHLHVLGSFSRVRRGDLVLQFICTRVDTGDACEPSPERHAWLLNQLRLTDAQLGRVARGHEIFLRLLAPVVQERTALQLAGGGGSGGGSGALSDGVSPAPSSRGESPPPTATAAATAATTTTASGAGAAAGGGGGGGGAGSPRLPSAMPAGDGGSGGALSGVADDAVRAAAAAEAAEAAAARVRRLLDKEILLRGAYYAHTLGCLTWAQLARMFVLMWPFVPHNATLSAAAAELYKQRQQQRQPRPKQQQPQQQQPQQQPQ